MQKPPVSCGAGDRGFLDGKRSSALQSLDDHAGLGPVHGIAAAKGPKMCIRDREYRKEDLMEAKKQILGVGENMGTEESKKIWEENAQFWDNAMGDESNEFHREVVRPKVTELLSPNPADYILDLSLIHIFGEP